MKAVVMAGGEGTRLRPMTSLLPKPMVPIVNQPVMEHILGLIKHHGITEVVATLAFMPQVITDYFGPGDEWGLSIEYAIEETPLGTAGSVKNAATLLPTDEPFIVISGDALTDIDLSDIIRFHREKGAAVTIALKAVDDPLDFGVVITDGEGRIERFLEKPSWGQVFSDRINTGIYVVEPWVLDQIPDGVSYDFSSELFPKLMDQGHALYGYEADGYWCDVGSRDSYLDVHRDILEGHSMIYIPGVRAREGLWVSDTASIDPAATLGDKVVIGDNVTIKAGAHVGDHVVIGDNCVIGQDARIDHSVLWSDSFVGSQSTVSGAVLCRGVDVRARSVLDSGVTIGSETVIGRGAHIGADVQVFPYKRVEPSATVTRSLIWESTGTRTLFSDAGLTGVVGIDITAELSLKVAEAFGSLLPKGSHVVVSRDTSASSRMVKRAMIAGLNAAGVYVRDLRVAPPAVSRFTTQKTRCVAGIHIAASRGEMQALTIDFFDKNGLNLTPAYTKKIERLYFRQEFRRSFFDDVGEIIYPPRPLEYYTVALNSAIDDLDSGDRWMKVVADMGLGMASLTLPLVAHHWHLNVVSHNAVLDTETSFGSGKLTDESTDILRRSAQLFAADFAVSFDRGAERIRLLTHEGTLLDGDSTLHLMVDLWCRTRPTVEGGIAVPLNASLAVERIAEKHGRQVVRPGFSDRSLAESLVDGRAVFAGCTEGGFLFGDFFPAMDGVLTTGMLARMLTMQESSLDELVRELPEFHKHYTAVHCPTDRKGAVMRLVTEAAATERTDLTEGVRVLFEDGWILVLPDADEPLVSIWAEGPSADVAAQRIAAWESVVSRAMETG